MAEHITVADLIAAVRDMRRWQKVLHEEVVHETHPAAKSEQLVDKLIEKLEAQQQQKGV